MPRFLPLRGFSSAPPRDRLLALASASIPLSGCARFPFLAQEEPPARVLHPEISRASGEVWLQPRYARERRPFVAPMLLEPGDWVETGPEGKAEILLPQGSLRLYSQTRVQVLFSFENRSAISQEFRLEAGEALFRKLTATHFLVVTEGLHVEPEPGSTLLIGSRGGVHHAACYEGEAEARNVRVRGQTTIHLMPGHYLTVDDQTSLIYLREREMPFEWKRWQDPEVLTAGLVPPPERSQERAR